MVTRSAMSSAKPVRWVPTVSVSFSLPCWASCRTATAWNGLPAELRANAVSSRLRIFRFWSAMPWLRDSTVRPRCDSSTTPENLPSAASRATYRS